MKKLTIILILLVLFFIAYAWQMKDEEILKQSDELQNEQTTATPEATAEPTAEPTTETEEESFLTGFTRYNTEPFESYYKDLEDNSHVTEEHWDMLRDIFDTYGIVLRFDDQFANGQFSADYVPLPDDAIDDAIETTYVTLDRLNPNKTESTTNLIGNMLQEIYCVRYFGEAGRSSLREIIVGFDSDEFRNSEGIIDAKSIIGTQISELANSLIRRTDMDLTEFRSYNDGFTKYQDEGDSTFIKDNVDIYESGSYDYLFALFDAGILNEEGQDNLVDDGAFYISGIFTDREYNDNPFWNIYAWSFKNDSNQTIFNKTNAMIKELEKLNPEWTPEYIIKNYCFKNLILDGNNYDAWETFAPYFD